MSATLCGTPAYHWKALVRPHSMSGSHLRATAAAGIGSLNVNDSVQGQKLDMILEVRVHQNLHAIGYASGQHRSCAAALASFDPPLWWLSAAVNRRRSICHACDGILHREHGFAWRQQPSSKMVNNLADQTPLPVVDPLKRLSSACCTPCSRSHLRSGRR